MQLTLQRIARRPTYTIGRLYIDGAYFCDTVEDTDRGLTSAMSLQEIRSRKIYGQTAIPAGTYRVTLAVQSAKFKAKSWAAFCDGYLPRLLDVKGYDGVLIHVGNSAEDSLGCILVGKNRQVGKVLDSTVTFQRLYVILKAKAIMGEPINITIR